MPNHDQRACLAAGLAVLFAVFFAGAARAENTDRDAAEEVCRRSDVIFCENWEDRDSVGWTDFQPLSSWGWLWGGISCSAGGCDFPYPGFDSDSALLLRLEPISTPGLTPDEAEPYRNSMYPRAAFNTPVGANDAVYFRYYVYWSPGFEFNVHITKNAYLESESLQWTVRLQARPNRDGSTTGGITTALPVVAFYCGQIDVAAGSPEEAYCYESGGDLRYFPNQPGYEDFRFETGRWYGVELMARPNPSGSSFGGHLSVWIDGVLMIDYDDVSVRHAAATDSFSGIWLTTYYGGGGQYLHPDQYVLYDDLVVSRSYIGPRDALPACGDGACAGGETSASCPADCPTDSGTMPTDGGTMDPDAAIERDAGTIDAGASDAGSPVTTRDGSCGCRTGGSGSGLGGVLGWTLASLATLAVRRRRRAARTTRVI